MSFLADLWLEVVDAWSAALLGGVGGLLIYWGVNITLRLSDLEEKVHGKDGKA